MASMFGGKPQQQETPAVPSVDEAQDRINQMRRFRGMRGRASAMLAQSNPGGKTGGAQVTGN